MAEMWHYTSDGKPQNAVTIQELKCLASAGTLKPTDMVWTEGMPRWMRANTVKELFPDSASAADAHFTSKEIAAPAASQVDASPAALGTRRYTAQSGTRSVRSPHLENGGSNVMIIASLLVGSMVLLGALGVGIAILLIPSHQPIAEKPVIDPDKDKKDGPLDGKQLKKDGKEPEVKDEPPPKGVLEGNNITLPPSPLILRNGVHELKFRVRGGYAAGINVSVLNKGKGTKFVVSVVKDGDPNFKVESEPGDTPSVQFKLAKTEIVVLRVQNVGTTANSILVTYNVSP
jgi:hypothetical protein